MFSISHLRRFCRDTDGAITVDWVVLTASVVGIGLAVLLAIGTTTNGVTTQVDTNMKKAPAISDVITDGSAGSDGDAGDGNGDPDTDG